MGLRGRLAILSEGYSNADFRTRISATYNFVQEIVQLAGEERALIKDAIVRSDRQRGDSVVVRSVLARPAVQEVVAEITEDAGKGAGAYARRRRTGVYRSIAMPVFDRFTSARKEARPASYLIPPHLSEVVTLLRRQGIAIDRTTVPLRMPVEIFPVDSIQVDPVFEGHRSVRVEGRWSRAIDSTLSAGWFLARTDQPLGTLAAYLLEPASEDGIVTWNLVDRELQVGAAYPVLRAARPVLARTVAVP
jgi:hypothetical protein